MVTASHRGAWRASSSTPPGIQRVTTWMRGRATPASALILLSIVLLIKVGGDLRLDRLLGGSNAAYTWRGKLNGMLPATLGGKDDSRAYAAAMATCSATLPVPQPLLVMDTPTDPPISVAVHPAAADIYISKPILDGDVAHMHMLMDLQNLKTLLESAVPGSAEAGGQGSLVVDVGANIGVVSLYFARLGYQLVSFEPVPHNFQRLAFSACLARELYDSSLTLFNAIVGNSPGQMFPMASHVKNMGHSKVVPGGTGLQQGMSQTSTLVNSTSLDVALGPMCADGRRPLLMKVDVEGFEGFVLDGARHVLQDCPPLFIFIELNKALIDGHEDKAPMRMVDILNLLHQSGYDLLSVALREKWDTAFWSQGSDGIRSFLSRIDPVLDWGDYLFRHKSA